MMNKYKIFKDPDFKEVFALLVEMRREDNDNTYPDWFLQKGKASKKTSKQENKQARKQASKKTSKKEKQVKKTLRYGE